MAVNTIIEFTKLVTGSEFMKRMGGIFTNPGVQSLYTLIGAFFQKLFYNIYSIPNLQNNKVLIVKPETLFSKIPSCNLFFPCMRNSVSLSRDPKNEPTRIFMVSDPLAMIVQGHDEIRKLVAVSAITGETNKNTQTLQPGNVKSVFNLMGNNKEVNSSDSKTFPLTYMSDFEGAYGMNLCQYEGFNEVMAFVLCNSPKESSKEAAKTMGTLAEYALLKERYSKRSGVIQTTFNPYAAPGFPMASLEKQPEDSKEDTAPALNIYGYVTNVVHNITPSGYNTTVEYGAGFFDDEPVPEVVPVLEDGYSDANVASTYKSILGKDVAAYDRKELKTKFKDNLDADETLGNVYRIIKRDATTLDTYLAGVADGATMKEDQNVMTLTGDYFRSKVQEVILKYSKKVLSEGKAFYTDEVR